MLHVRLYFGNPFRAVEMAKELATHFGFDRWDVAESRCAPDHLDLWEMTPTFDLIVAFIDDESRDTFVRFWCDQPMFSLDRGCVRSIMGSLSRR